MKAVQCFEGNGHDPEETRDWDAVDAVEILKSVKHAHNSLVDKIIRAPFESDKRPKPKSIIGRIVRYFT